MPIQCTRPPKRIEIERDEGPLILRRAEVGDAPAVVGAIQESLAELHAFMPWAHNDEQNRQPAQERRIEQTLEQWDNRSDFIWHMFEGPSGGEHLVGCMGLHNRSLNPLALEVGYWVRSSAAGRGVCTAAVRAIIVMGFDAMGLERIQVGCDIENTGSRRVIEKSGFLYEALLRRSLPATPIVGNRKTWRGSGDQLLYGLTQDDLERLSWAPHVRRLCHWVE